MTDISPTERLARESRRAALAAGDASRPAEDSPALGSTWALPGVDSTFVLIQRDPTDGERFLAVPADQRRQVGSQDVLAESAGQSAPLVLRCAFPLWLGNGQLRTGAAIGRVDEVARHRAQAVVNGQASEHPERVEVDREAEYRDWIQEGPEADREGILARRRWRARLPLAAAVAGLLTLGAWVVTLQLRSDPQLTAGLGEPGPLFTVGDVLRGTPKVDLPSQDYLSIRFDFVSNATSYSTFRIEIFEAGGSLVKSKIGKPGPRGHLEVPIPSEHLRVGFYRVRVTGVEDGKEEVLSNEGFQIVLPPSQ